MSVAAISLAAEALQAEGETYSSLNHQHREMLLGKGEGGEGLPEKGPKTSGQMTRYLRLCPTWKDEKENKAKNAEQEQVR